MSALAQPSLPTPLSVRTHQNFRKIRKFLRQKVRTFASEDPPVCKMSALDKPLPTADVFYGRPLSQIQYEALMVDNTNDQKQFLNLLLLLLSSFVALYNNFSFVASGLK